MQRRFSIFFSLCMVIIVGLVFTPARPPALAQTTSINGGRTIAGGAWNLSSASSTFPMSVVTSLPGTCTVGQFIFNSVTLHTYACTATNTFTQVDGGGLVASGTATMGTAGITGGACATAVTVAASGATVNSTLIFNPNTNPTAVAGYTPAAPLYIWGFPTANNVNFIVCNSPGSATVNPSALTLNWKVF